MTPSCLTLLLRERDGGEQIIGTLRWPAALADEARRFVRDNLLAARLGDVRRAQQLLDAGVLPPDGRAAFLAERLYVAPEPPEALASQLDLEDVAAEFHAAMSALRAAPPTAALHLVWS